MFFTGEIHCPPSEGAEKRGSSIPTVGVPVGHPGHVVGVSVGVVGSGVVVPVPVGSVVPVPV